MFKTRIRYGISLLFAGTLCFAGISAVVAHFVVTPRRPMPWQVVDVAFSDDNTELITLSARNCLSHTEVICWDVNLHRPKHVREFPLTAPRYAALSPNGRYLGGLKNNCLLIYETHTGKLVRRTRIDNAPLSIDSDNLTDLSRLVAFSGDGRTCVAALCDHLIITAIDTSSREKRIALPDNAESVAIAPDGSLVLVALPQSRQMIIAGEGFDTVLQRRWEASAYPTLSIDNAIALGDRGWYIERVLLYQKKSQRLPAVDLGSTGEEFDLVVLPRGNLTAPDPGRVWGMCFAPNARSLAVAMFQDCVNVWDTVDARLDARLNIAEKYDLYPFALAFSHDGEYLAVGGENRQEQPALVVYATKHWRAEKFSWEPLATHQKVRIVLGVMAIFVSIGWVATLMVRSCTRPNQRSLSGITR